MSVVHALRIDGCNEILGTVGALCQGLQPDISTTIVTRRACGARTANNGTATPQSISTGHFNPIQLPPLWPALLLRQVRKANLIALHLPFALGAAAVVNFLPPTTKLVVHWHAPPDKTFGTIEASLTRQVLERADAVIASSPPLTGSAELDSVKRKIKIIPFGINLDYWSGPLTVEEHKILVHLRTCFRRIIVCIGPLVAWKGLDVLMEAMRNLNAHLFIVGEGPSRRWLERRVAEENLDSRVTLCGTLPCSHLRAMLRAASVLALPSTTSNEIFGFPQLQAMASGVPTVNTLLPTGVPWVARHERESLTVPPGNALLLAEALHRIMEDRNLSAMFARAGRERARQSFSLPQYLAATMRVYRGILGS